MKERRRWERYELAYPLESEREGDIKPLLLIDVSKGGAAFSSSGQIEMQERLSLRFFLKKKAHQLNAVVVYVQRKGKEQFNIGVQFTNTPEDFHTDLDREIEEIIRLHEEKKLRRYKSLTFKQASKEYFEHTHSPKKQ